MIFYVTNWRWLEFYKFYLSSALLVYDGGLKNANERRREKSVPPPSPRDYFAIKLLFDRQCSGYRTFNI